MFGLSRSTAGSAVSRLSQDQQGLPQSAPISRMLWLPFLAFALLVVLVLGSGAIVGSSSLPTSMRAALDPTMPALLWALFVSSALSTVAYVWSRRGATRATGLVVTACLAGVSLLLGLASYWPCADDEATPFAQLYWAMALFVGNVEWFDAGARCSGPLPLALQAARLTALSATFAGIAGIIIAVSRRRLESLVARHSRRVVLVLGLEPEVASVIRVLASHLDQDTRLVVIESSGDPRIAVEARSARASVVSLDLSVGRSLDDLLLRRGQIKAKEIYVLGSNLAETIRTVRRVEEVMNGHKAPETHIARLIARIDDPWVAQVWRRKHVAAQTPWLADAVSFYEETARYIVEQARIAGARQIVLVGNSALSLAVLSECAQRRRERRMLSRETDAQQATGGQPEPAVVLMGEDCESLREDHRRIQAGFGNDSESPPITVVREAVTTDAIVKVAAPDSGSVIALTAAPAENVKIATRLAAARPDLMILAWSTTEPGIPVEPLIGRLYPFGLNMVGRNNRPPVDNWTRLARLLHQEYVGSEQRAVPDTPPSRLPWDAGLPEFYQSSNVRQLSCLLSEVTRLGRSWSAPTSGAHEDDWTAEEIHALAAAEHRSWRSFYLAHGWRYAPVRDDARLRHNLLTDWESLDGSIQRDNEDSVRRGLLLLESLGYRATRSAWHQYRRRGEVTAVRLTETWEWKSDQGSTLAAQRGDWKVTADDGRVWSVDQERFPETYRLVSPDRYERVGAVRARCAHAGERVNTIEGEGTADQGDWVVEGASGERWLVPEEHFDDVYERADGGAVRRSVD